MSFIIGDEIITEEIPAEVDELLHKLKERTREKSAVLMHTIANSDKYMAYIIPGAGMVMFVDELRDERKMFRYLINNKGELFIDNKQRRGQMLCPLFDIMEEQIKVITGRNADTVSDDSEYKLFDSFMPKIVETIDQILTDKPNIFNM